MGSGDGNSGTCLEIANAQGGVAGSCSPLCYAEGAGLLPGCFRKIIPAPYVAAVVPAGWDTWSPWRRGHLECLLPVTA